MNRRSDRSPRPAVLSLVTVLGEPVAHVRPNRVREVRERIAGGYYDRAEVRLILAEVLLVELAAAH